MISLNDIYIRPMTEQISYLLRKYQSLLSLVLSDDPTANLQLQKIRDDNAIEYSLSCKSIVCAEDVRWLLDECTKELNEVEHEKD